MSHSKGSSRKPNKGERDERRGKTPGRPKSRSHKKAKPSPKERKSPVTAGQFDDRISNPFRHWEPTGEAPHSMPEQDRKDTSKSPDIEGMWVAACERRLMRFGNVPIVSRVDSISGSQGTRRPLYVLSSSTRMLGEKRDSSLDAFGMRTFASPMMLQPIGRNNEMPEASEGTGDGITVYTDASHKGSSVGISAMFDPDDGGAYAYAGTLLVDTDLDGLINASESIAAVSAVLAAIAKGYRRIRVMSDSSELIRMWNREMSPRRTVMRQLTVLRDIVDRNGIEVVMQHVYGHRSDFMNVAADGIAQVHERMAMESPLTGEPRQPEQQQPQARRRKGRGKGKQQGQQPQQQPPRDQRSPQQEPQPQDRPETRRPDGKDEPPAGETAEQHAPEPRDVPEAAATESRPARRRRTRRKAQPEPQAEEPVVAEEPTVAEEPPVDESRDAAEDVPEAVAEQGPTNPETATLVDALHETDPKITRSKVAHCLERETYLNWPRVDAESGGLIRSLLCEPDRRLPIADIDAIWDAVAPNVAKGLEPRRRKHRTVIRAAVVARMCAVPLKRTVDATRNLGPEATG